MKISSLKIGIARAEQGDWIDDILGMPGVRLRVRGVESASYKDSLRQKLRAIPKQDRERDGAPKLTATELAQGEAMCEALLLDWSGVEAEDGAPQPYDRELAHKLLGMPFTGPRTS
jgi:hypothetical protein